MESMRGSTHCDLEMMKSQDSIDHIMDRIRTKIAEKTIESDQMIEHCGQLLRENRQKLQRFKSHLNDLECSDIKLKGDRQSGELKDSAKIIQYEMKNK